MSSTLKNNYTEQQLHTVKRLETYSLIVTMQRFNYCHEPPPLRLTDAYIQGKNHEHDHGRNLLKDLTKYLLINNSFNSEVYSVLFSTTFTSNSLAMYGDLTHLLLLCNHRTNTECEFVSLL